MLAKLETLMLRNQKLQNHSTQEAKTALKRVVTEKLRRWEPLPEGTHIHLPKPMLGGAPRLPPVHSFL